MNAFRPPAVEPYLRGAAWPATAVVAYPRADLGDLRLPTDTAAAAAVPAGVRLELAGDADAVDIAYETITDQLGYRGAGGGTTFSLWRGGVHVDECAASLGRGNVRLRLGSGDERVVVYLPEGMKPRIVELAAIDGSIAPAPGQPRWIAYGDSIVEGWVSDGPALAWPAIAGREHGFNVLNMGYAGSARGELATAEHIAGLDAEVISLSWGTNCWSRSPHSTDMMRASTSAFVRIVRSGHPAIPIVVASPLIRPDAEATPNALGATLDDLRRAMEEAVDLMSDDNITLVRGRDILPPELLADAVHPGSAGHRVLARTMGEVIADAHRGSR